MTTSDKIVHALRREPATFINLCKLGIAEFGEIDSALVSLKKAGRVRFDERMGAWRAA